MGKKYFCDYCGKSFADSLDARRKHNAAILHKRMRDVHYKQFIDARTKLKEELQKGPCRRIQTGFTCKFGDECKFSHLQPYELDQLKYDAQVEEELGSVKLPSQLQGKMVPSVEHFLSRMKVLLKERETESCFAIAAVKSSSLAIEKFPIIVKNNVEKEILPFPDNGDEPVASDNSVNLRS